MVEHNQVVRVIKTKNLTKHYGATVAVNRLNLEIFRGELFGFLGPNGAGKTTTIQMFIGLLQPTAGTIEVLGHDVRSNPIEVKRSVGYLAQTPYQYEKLTGREFLRFLGGLYRQNEDQLEERVDNLLEVLLLKEKADEIIESYSGGMRKKLGLCAALLHNPPILLLDEPLAGLDPYSARLIKDLLRSLCERGTTVFLSTHILEVAERVCDRVGILDNGRLIAVGTIENLRYQAQSAPDSTLEDLFLKLTGGDEETEMTRMLMGAVES